MATTAQRLAVLEAAVAKLKTADIALGTRVTNEVNNRAAAVVALGTRLDDHNALPVQENNVPSIGRRAHSASSVVMETINVGAGGVGVTVTADNVTIANKIIIGPQFATYNGNERGISAVGTVGNKISNLTIRNCQIRNFGHAGIYIVHGENILIEDCTIEDTVYTGIQVLSCVGGMIRNNTVRRIGVFGSEANSGNSYGIGVTASVSPMSSDVTVDGNTVETVQNWEALDTHGGLRIRFLNNIVRYSRRGVMLTTGVAGENATDCDVIGNQLLSPVSIPSGQQYAVAPVDTIRSTITGNTITGWGAGRDLLTGYPNEDMVYSGNIVTP